MRFVKDAELSPLRLWCWLRALSEAPVTQEPLPSEFWEAAGEPFLSFTTSVGLVGVPQSQLCNCAGGGLELNEIHSGRQSSFSFSSSGAMSFQGAVHASCAAALLCSTGIPGGGGGDAAGSLLLFPVLSELLSPLRWLGRGCCSSDLQLFVSLPATSQQQSEIAAPALPPHPAGAAGERKQGMSYSDRFSRRQGKNTSYCHQHEGAIPTC